MSQGSDSSESRPIRQCVLAFAVVCIAVACIPSSSSAAPCRASKRDTLTKHGPVSIFQLNTHDKSTRNDRVYVCSRRIKKPILLRAGSEAVNDNFYGKLASRGDFAAFTRLYAGGSGDGAENEEIEVVNLRTGQNSIRAKLTDTTPSSLRGCDYYGPDEWCYVNIAGRLRVTAQGSVAFAAHVQETSDDDSPPRRAFNGVYRLEFDDSLKRCTRTALDHVRAKATKTLRVSGNKMWWKNRGRLRSAWIR